MSKSPLTTARRRRRQAFSLVEVTLALGVMAFCIVPVFGLLPVGINSNQTSLNQTRAASVAANLCADVRGTALTNTKSPRFGVDVADAGSQTLYFTEAGDAVTTATAFNARYRVSVTVTPPPTAGTASAAQGATWLSVLVTWPAAATATNAAGKYQGTTAINRS